MDPRPYFAFDFHVHTSYSYDCLMPPKLVIKLARRRGLAGISITDHETLEGAREAVRANSYQDFTIIPGIEVNSEIGDVIGLYIKHDIKSRRFSEIVSEIHDQGGLVYIPHPLRTFGASGTRAFYEQHSEIDLWEMYNGRYSPKDFLQSRELFPALGITARLCGSDAHFPWEVGVFRTMLPGIPCDAESLRRLSFGADLTASPRSDFALSAGISLGAMTKAFKRREYGKFGTSLASLPYKVVRRSLRTVFRRTLSD